MYNSMPVMPPLPSTENHLAHVSNWEWYMMQKEADEAKEKLASAYALSIGSFFTGAVLGAVVGAVLFFFVLIDWPL